ncbi:unnamed protein product [Calypogeia fissa]
MAMAIRGDSVERWRWRSIGGAIQDAGCISKEPSHSRRQDASQLNRQESAKGAFTHGVPIELIAEAERAPHTAAAKGLGKANGVKSSVMQGQSAAVSKGGVAITSDRGTMASQERGAT